MAKNKGTMGKDKPSEAAQPDQFVTGMGRVAERLKPHAMRFAFLGVALAVVLIGYSVYSWYGKRQAAAATELYHRALLSHDVPLASELAEAAADADGDPLRNLPASYPDATARATAVLAALDTLGREHGDSAVASEAGLLRAEVLMELGRIDEAATAYRDYAASATSPTLRLSAREGMAYALEAKAAGEKDPATRERSLEAALAAFEAMQADDAGRGRARSLYHQGRILAVLGRRDDARKRFGDALTKAPDASLKVEVEARLAALEAAGAP